MSRSSTLILLGVLSALVPVSGLPVAIRSLLALVFGVSIVGIGLSMRTRSSLPIETEPPEEKQPTPPVGVSPI